MAPSLPRTAEQARSLSWDQLTLVFATQFAEEIASVANGDGDALLRRRLASLSSEERRVLRETLSEPDRV